MKLGRKSHLITYSAAIHSENDMIYIPSKKWVYKINLITKSTNLTHIKDADEYGFRDEPKSIIIDDELYVFGCYADYDDKSYNKHSIYYIHSDGVESR